MTALNAINPAHIQEIKDLVEDGDVNLAERRETFKKIVERPTTLNDEQLIKAIAATDDDDDELFVQNVKAVELEGQVT